MPEHNGPPNGVVGVIGGILGAWETPPQEFNEVQRRGFHDGVEAAKRDFSTNRRPHVDDHDEFRRPQVAPEFVNSYRESFRRGYQVAMSHLMGEGQGQMRQPPPPWDAPPQEFNEFERRGFHDGMEGARKDFDNHRQPDVDNRDEYRHPSGVPGEMREAYRAAFRRGYQVATSHYTGDPNYR
jgi:hypothetical protein